MLPAHNKQAFTLIEIIVTVTIAAILLSLILPAIARTREAGRRIACVNNLRQISTAFNCYLEDNNGKIFWGTPDMVKAGQHLPYGDAMDWFMWGGRPTGNLYTAQGGLFNMTTCFGREMRPLNRYLDNNYEIFRCPSDKGRGLGWIVSGEITPLYEAVGNSYDFNAFGPQSVKNGGITGYDISSIKTSSKTILFHCETAFPDLTQDWHNKELGGNVCFVDGHVKFMVIETTASSGKDKYGTPYSWQP